MQLSDISPGDEVELEVYLSEDTVNKFSNLTGDYAPIHFDEQFARERGFDGPIAHGLLISSFVSGVLGNQLPGKNSVINEINFKYHAPVYAEQTINILVCAQRVITAVNAICLDITITEKSRFTKVASGRAICSFPTSKI